MAKLHKLVKNTPGEKLGRAVVGEKTYDEFHPVGTSMVQQDDAAKAAEQAVADVASKPTIPLPDEDELARIRRRRAARRTGGRDSTVLTGDDAFGPG